MAKIVKTTFEEEQKTKDKYFLSLTPLQRWELALKVRELMRKSTVNYSYTGLKVKITKPSK
jgi:hypothetical protein